MNINRYYQTLRYLKPIQIRYQIYYRLRKIWKAFLKIQYPLSIQTQGYPLTFSPWIDKPVSYQNNSFTFLNQTKNISNSGINWNEKQFGLLWAYNLNYMDFLLQPKMKEVDGIKLIHDFIKQLPANKTGLEPYPTSLRGINWIKFLSANNIKDQQIDHSLYAQYKILADSIEYHLLGNHLLENGFSLLVGAYYFKDNDLYKKASQILKNELQEQVLQDGGHFELSPMYHQIILDRLLDSINLLQNNKQFEDQEQLLVFLKRKASKMLGWLKNMTFQNGDIPHFNDSTNDIAPSTFQLLDYAERLNIKFKIQDSKLSISGYRKFSGKNYECIVDVGSIGPNYIPGHAHADMLSFVLYINQQPVIIDTGISTYEKNVQRHLERSTSSHNTVVVSNKNQSDVWGGFRVGKRAKINIEKDESQNLAAEHDGYKPSIHQRKFLFETNSFIIFDKVSNSKTANAYFHFHHECKIEVQDNKIIVDGKYLIEISNAIKTTIEDYEQPLGFNKFVNSRKVVIHFGHELKTHFILN